MTLKIIGGPNLRARLANVAEVGPEFAAEWAADAADRMRRTKPGATRAASNVFTPKIGSGPRGLRAAVYGAFWWIFVDRGTKAHDITGAGGKNPPSTLKFEWGGRTIFTKRVHRKRMRRRPFITKAAQDALAGSRFADTVIKAWNFRRLRTVGHKRFL